MSAPNSDRWQFRVIDIPKPMRSGVAYRWAFVAMGVGVGAVWEMLLTTWFGQRRGSTVMLLLVAVIFLYQAYDIHRSQKRIEKLTEEIRQAANRTIGPELTEGEPGDGTHER